MYGNGVMTGMEVTNLVMKLILRDLQMGKIKQGEVFRYESIIGSIFKGVFNSTTKVGEFDAVIPEITGSCYLTGVSDYIIDQEDAQRYGFVVG